MGKMLDRQQMFDSIKRGPATNLLAEVFYDELLFILGEWHHDRVMVVCHGMNSRTKSKDVLDVSTRHIPTSNTTQEYIQLDLSRNSFYHQLPELLFHPLVLSKPGMSNKEIVEVIRENEKLDKELVRFFSPIDTILFKEKVIINHRHLNFFSDAGSRKNLAQMVEMFENSELTISEHEKYKLFLFLCKTETYKEDLKALEHILHIVLGLRVRLRLEDHEITEDVYSPVGYGILGLTTGISGKMISETKDLEAMIMYNDPLDDYEEIRSVMSNVRGVLEFFILSTRDIHVKYMVYGHKDFILGQNRLSYNTIL